MTPEEQEQTMIDNFPEKTGKTLSKRYVTPYRRRNGPIRVRWVNFFPINTDRTRKGFAGFPDPLLSRPTTYLKAGDSQGEENRAQNQEPGERNAGHASCPPWRFQAADPRSPPKRLPLAAPVVESIARPAPPRPESRPGSTRW